MAAVAQPQPVVGSATCVVVPVQDASGSVTSVDSQKCTDALALALEDTREFVVTAKRDLERELAALGMNPPLSVEEQMQLAKRLQVEQVITGQIARLAVDPGTGQVAIRLEVKSLDMATGEFLNGADVSLVTKAVPGWNGERTQVVNEAVRAASVNAVEKMRISRFPIGFVTSVTDLGGVSINIGAADGIESGMEVLLLRPTWQADLKEILMEKVGKFVVGELEQDLCNAAKLSGRQARVGDRAYVLYKPPMRMSAERRSQSMGKTIKLAAALGLLLGLATVANGDASTDAPTGVRAYLYQSAPGEEAVIQLYVPHRSIPLVDQIFAYLFFRAENQRNFSLAPEYLVDIWGEARLPGNVWDDSAEVRADLSRDYDWTYINQDGEEDTVTLTANYNDPPLQPGSTYYYRVQRVVEPFYQAGGGSIGTTQINPAQVFVEPDLQVDPTEALSDGSAPAGPVTYFSPVVLGSPERNSQSQSTTSITFTWSSTTGANEYVLQVFPSDDPDGLRNPKWQVTKRSDTGGTLNQTLNANFGPITQYYWRVGARRTGERPPVNGLGNQTGWLFSEIRSFTTAPGPPWPPAQSSAVTPGTGSGSFRGSWGLPRYGH